MGGWTLITEDNATSSNLMRSVGGMGVNLVVCAHAVQWWLADITQSAAMCVPVCLEGCPVHDPRRCRMMPEHAPAYMHAESGKESTPVASRMSAMDTTYDGGSNFGAPPRD